MNYQPKVKVFFLYTLASVFLLLCPLVWVMHCKWFPGPYFFHNESIDALKLIVPILIISGPVLAAVLFNPRKSKVEKALDMSLVTTIHLGIFIWFLIQIYPARIYTYVYHQGAFEAVHLYEYKTAFRVITEKSVQNKRPSISWYEAPKIALIAPPMTAIERAMRKQSAKNAYLNGHTFLSDFRLYTEQNTDLPETELALETELVLPFLTPEDQAALSKAIKASPQLEIYGLNLNSKVYGLVTYDRSKHLINDIFIKSEESLY